MERVVVEAVVVRVVLVEMVVKELVVVKMVLGCMKNMRHGASFKNDIGS